MTRTLGTAAVVVGLAGILLGAASLTLGLAEQGTVSQQAQQLTQLRNALTDTQSKFKGTSADVITCADLQTLIPAIAEGQATYQGFYGSLTQGGDPGTLPGYRAQAQGQLQPSHCINP